jgi:hypothetical protein
LVWVWGACHSKRKQSTWAEANAQLMPGVTMGVILTLQFASLVLPHEHWTHFLVGKQKVK